MTIFPHIIPILLRSSYILVIYDPKITFIKEWNVYPHFIPIPLIFFYFWVNFSLWDLSAYFIIIFFLTAVKAVASFKRREFIVELVTVAD